MPGEGGGWIRITEIYKRYFMRKYRWYSIFSYIKIIQLFIPDSNITIISYNLLVNNVDYIKYLVSRDGMMRANKDKKQSKLRNKSILSPLIYIFSAFILDISEQQDSLYLLYCIQLQLKFLHHLSNLDFFSSSY